MAQDLSRGGPVRRKTERDHLDRGTAARAATEADEKIARASGPFSPDITASAPAGISTVTGNSIIRKPVLRGSPVTTRSRRVSAFPPNRSRLSVSRATRVAGEMST